MTPKKFASYVRFKTKTNSNSFSDTDLMLSMEVRQIEMAKAILKASEDILLVPQYANLEDDRRDYKDPGDNIARSKRVAAKFDGTNWIPLTEIDLTDIDFPIATEANIVANFNSSQLSESNPQGARFDIMRNSLILYSGTITDVTAGLRYYCDTYPSIITDLSVTNKDLSEDPSTTTHGIPKALHLVWAMGVIIDYKESRSKPIPLSEREVNYDSILLDSIETLSHGNLDREVLGGIPPASSRGNDGEDY